jgi:hypothetical protein
VLDFLARVVAKASYVPKFDKAIDFLGVVAGGGVAASLFWTLAACLRLEGPVFLTASLTACNIPEEEKDRAC